MVEKEQDLAKAIMRGDSLVEISENLVDGVAKIKAPTDAVWKSITGGELRALALCYVCQPGIVLNVLPAVCAGYGNIANILGASGTLCAVKLFLSTHTMGILTDLRNRYELSSNVLKRK